MTRTLILLAASLTLTACATKHAAESDEGTRVALADLSAPARAAVEREIASGSIDRITRETERGQTVYDVEATVNGQHTEYTIADSDGSILGREIEIPLSDLPAPVLHAARAFFDKGATLTATKGVEYGQTTYEINGPKNGSMTEKTWDAAGKPEKPEH